MARPLAGPPSLYSPAGISTAVTKLETTSKTLIKMAAAASNLRVLAMRPGISSPSTRGITETPVSKPERPSARRGNTSTAARTISRGPPDMNKSPFHLAISSGWAITSETARPSMTTLSSI